MKRNKWLGIAAFAILLGYLTLGSPWKLWAQASAGYTKVGSVAFGTNTFTDSTIADGTVVTYQVTAANAAGESTPLQFPNGLVPATGTHTATLTWSAPTGGGTPTTYNVYRQVVTVPNQPGAPSLTIN